MQKQLRGVLDRFLKVATAEEQYFLKEVLISWDSEFQSNQPEELGIANAFEVEISNRSQYLLVDSRPVYEATLAFIEGYRKEYQETA